MPQYNRAELGRIATESGFVRDTFEKVLRLKEILRFLNEDEFLREHLLLKGGTAINLTVFNLPRLSVDIDMDYIPNDTREDMLDFNKIRRDLFPVLNKKDNFQLDEKKKLAKDYIAELMVLTSKEQEYLDSFEQKKYMPELLFEDKNIIARVKNHPMALWRCRQNMKR